ncbi:hypothetical protein BDR07DRAFT_1408469 [Suillus spraguei]|nr:hypothetical protein BDR07DRAFT_1408469 [Suillus spraguei]
MCKYFGYLGGLLSSFAVCSSSLSGVFFADDSSYSLESLISTTDCARSYCLCHFNYKDYARDFATVIVGSLCSVHWVIHSRQNEEARQCS